MRITALSSEPIAVLPYWNARRGGGTERVRLPLLRATTPDLPSGLEGLVITSDLQGRTEDDRLVGISVPGWLADLAARGLVPPPSRCGAVLCGDLWAKPGSTRRGGAGDVRPVWRAFHAAFRWVVGVAGNHDEFGTRRELAAFRRAEGRGYVDGTACERDGLRVAGVGGLVGDPGKPGRRTASEFEAALDHVLHARPDLLLMHHGPDVPEHGAGGLGLVRERLSRYPVDLLVCAGHTHWDEPLAHVGSAQVLNVDGRVILICRAASTIQ